MRKIYVSLYVEDGGYRAYRQRRVLINVEDGTSMRDAAKTFRLQEAKFIGGILAKKPSLLRIEIETELPRGS